MTVETTYRLQEIQKSLGPHFCLEVPQLDIRRGEILGLLGPTGAGKSTLLRLLTGLEEPTRGDLRFEDSPFPAPEPALTIRRRIAMVHQQPVLLTGSVRWNVEYGLRLRQSTQRRHKVDDILAQLELTSMASQSAQRLSGGQAQLVALARALVLEPDVLLLDEPTAHLDPAYITLVERAIRQYQQRRQATIVWVTHNLFQARRVATRTALLLNGQLVEVAPTGQFFTNPSDPRTNDFVQGRIVY